MTTDTEHLLREIMRDSLTVLMQAADRVHLIAQHYPLELSRSSGVCTMGDMAGVASFDAVLRTVRSTLNKTEALAATARENNRAARAGVTFTTPGSGATQRVRVNAVAEMEVVP